MSIPKQMTGALMENLLTILAHSDEHGKFVASVIEPQLFEGDMRIMAERIMGYWRTEKCAPKRHTTDLFADILEDRGNRRADTFRRILGAMLQLSEGINASYVLAQLKTFTRMQRLKDAVFRSAEVLSQQGETTIQDVESILADILKARDFLFEPGLSLERDFDVIIEHLKHHYREFDTGIPLFDNHDVVPSRATLFLVLGAAGAGKTWAMVHLGKRALLQRKKVLHITPELSAEDTMLRYYMAYFGVSKRHQKIRTTMLERDRDSRLTGWSQEKVDVDFDFESTSLREELLAHISSEGGRMDNIRIKRVAPRAMSVGALSGFMDSLETAEGFVPDLLIVDSAYLLKTDSVFTEYRHALGRSYEDLRALAVERNIAVVASHQLSKEGATSKRAAITHVAEDWSIIQTADIAITHSATKAEQKFGLARVYADKVRNDVGGLSVLITQNYATGAYVLDSLRLRPEYFDLANRELAEQLDHEEQLAQLPHERGEG